MFFTIESLAFFGALTAALSNSLLFYVCAVVQRDGKVLQMKDVTSAVATSDIDLTSTKEPQLRFVYNDLQ